MGGYAVPFDQPDQDERYSKVAKLLAGSSVPQPAPVGVAPNPIVAGSSPAIIAQAAQPRSLQELGPPPDVPSVEPYLKSRQDMVSKIQGESTPNTTATTDASGKKIYKPGIGRTLGAILLGALAGPHGAESVADNVLYGKLNRAEKLRTANLATDEKMLSEMDRNQSIVDQHFKDVTGRYSASTRYLQDLETDKNRDQKLADQEKKLGGAYDWARATQDEDGTYSAPRLSDGEMVKGLTPPKFLKPESEPKNEYELAMAMSNAQRSGDKDKIAKYQGAFDVIAKLKRAGRNTDASDVAKAIQIAQFRSREEDKATAEIDRKVEKEKHNLQTNPAYALDEDAMAKAADEIDKKYEAERQQRSQQIQDDADKMLGITKAGKKLQSPKKQVQQPASQQKATPQSHVFSVSAWQKANPGKDVEAAKRLAQSSNYQVTP